MVKMGIFRSQVDEAWTLVASYCARLSKMKLNSEFPSLYGYELVLATRDTLCEFGSQLEAEVIVFTLKVCAGCWPWPQAQTVTAVLADLAGVGRQWGPRSSASQGVSALSFSEFWAKYIFSWLLLQVTHDIRVGGVNRHMRSSSPSCFLVVVHM